MPKNKGLGNNNVPSPRGNSSTDNILLENCGRTYNHTANNFSVESRSDQSTVESRSDHLKNESRSDQPTILAVSDNVYTKLKENIDRHLILGGSTGETHVQNYVKEHPDVQVFCLCRDPLVPPVVDNDVYYWEGDFNSREVWDELLLNFGEKSFTRIIFDSSTSKFMDHVFWTQQFHLVVRMLVPKGQLYFDSYHMGTVSYDKSFAEDLTYTGKIIGTLLLLPLANENHITFTADLQDLSNNIFVKLEDKVSQKEEFYIYLENLNQSKYGNYNLENNSYPIKNTTYPVAKYLVFTRG